MASREPIPGKYRKEVTVQYIEVCGACGSEVHQDYSPEAPNESPTNMRGEV